MYNRYIPDGAVYTRVPMEEDRPRPSPPHARETRESRGQGELGGLLSRLGLEGDGIKGLLNRFHLDGMDSGDLLLLLIVLLLWSEGEDMDLVLALGLALVLGLGDQGEQKP